MKQISSHLICFFALCISNIIVLNAQDPESEVKDTIRWFTLEEALEAQQTNKKKILIDIYTDWCHWCKAMDQKTFTDTTLISLINTHFYPVKFNGESKEEIEFQGKQFKYVIVGRRGINSLAYYLMNGRTAFPTIVFLNEDLEKIGATAGFKTAEQLAAELKTIIGPAAVD